MHTIVCNSGNPNKILSLVIMEISVDAADGRSVDFGMLAADSGAGDREGVSGS